MSKHEIDGNVSLSGKEAADIIRLQNTRIKQLEGLLERTQNASPKEVVERVSEAMKILRMHQVILLYTGPNSAADLAARVEDAAAVAALDQAWNLDNAPLPQSVIEQVRAATVGGMNRF